MELLAMATVTFIVALLVRRKEAFILRWKPTRHTWMALATGIAAFILSASLLLFEERSFPSLIIDFVLIVTVCGIVVPIGYTLLVERKTLASLGLTHELWLPSLILNVVLGGLLGLIILSEADLGSLDWVQLGKATSVLMVGGLFELFLYYGFIHLRLRKAFGTIPAIVFTSAVYVLWHVGTQLPYEPDPVAALWKLFLVGIMSQSVFSITYNLLIIWPFFFGAGVLIDYVVNLDAVGAVSGDFLWAIGTLALMTVAGTALLSISKLRSSLRLSHRKNPFH